MSQDARQRTKTYLDTYLLNANLLKDDDATQVSFMTAFGKPPYSILRIFIDQDVDLVYSISEPKTTPLTESDTTTWGYKARVPIATFCIDKSGITGEKLKWKADKELRRVVEDQPFGSFRRLAEKTDNDHDLSGTTVYSTRWILAYLKRKTT